MTTPSARAAALEQAHRAKIPAVQHGGQAAYLIALDKLCDHRFDCPAREAATPVSAGQLVGNSRPPVGMQRCLNVADELGAREPDDPVEPPFPAARRAP